MNREKRTRDAAASKRREVLENLRKARESGVSRTEQHEVCYDGI